MQSDRIGTAIPVTLAAVPAQGDRLAARPASGAAAKRVRVNLEPIVVGVDMRD